MNRKTISSPSDVPVVGHVDGDVDDAGVVRGRARDVQVLVRERRVAEPVTEDELWLRCAATQVRLALIPEAIAEVVVHVRVADGVLREGGKVVEFGRPGDGKLPAEVGVAEQQLAQRPAAVHARVPGHDHRLQLTERRDGDDAAPDEHQRRRLALGSGGGDELGLVAVRLWLVRVGLAVEVERLAVARERVLLPLVERRHPRDHHDEVGDEVVGRHRLDGVVVPRRRSRPPPTSLMPAKGDDDLVRSMNTRLLPSVTGAHGRGEIGGATFLRGRPQVAVGDLAAEHGDPLNVGALDRQRVVVVLQQDHRLDGRQLGELDVAHAHDVVLHVVVVDHVAAARVPVVGGVVAEHLVLEADLVRVRHGPLEADLLREDVLRGGVEVSCAIVPSSTDSSRVL